MSKAKGDRTSYLSGFGASLLLHLLLAAVSIIVLESQRAQARRAPQVFTVSLEGGSSIGGISKAPEGKKKQSKVIPNLPQSSQEDANTAKKADEVRQVEIETPTIVDLEDKKKKAAEEKKRRLEARKKLRQKKRKEKEEGRKRKAKEKAEAKKRLEKERAKAEAKKKEREKKEAERRKKEAERKKAEARRRRDKNLKDAIRRASAEYTGESANAGGTGFGAAKLGGKGMGGGTLASAEFIAYANALERHIKRGWRWGVPGANKLEVKVLVRIMKDGTVSDVRVENSSGSVQFDDSAIRAIKKSSPVPPAPEKLYRQFSEVSITFDSN